MIQPDHGPGATQDHTEDADQGAPRNGKRWPHYRKGLFPTNSGFHPLKIDTVFFITWLLDFFEPVDINTMSYTDIAANTMLPVDIAANIILSTDVSFDDILG
jgi:hypothetical protein